MEQGQYLTHFQRKLLLKSLESNLRPEYRRRIEIMLLADQGESQTQICKALGCSQETARYWMVVAQTGKAHNWNEYVIGRPKTVNQRYLDHLRELVSNSPRECGYPFQRWTAQWLSKHLAKELEISVSPQHINRLLKQMGLSTRTKPAVDKEITQKTDTGNSRLVIRDLTLTTAPDHREQQSFMLAKTLEEVSEQVSDRPLPPNPKQTYRPHTRSNSNGRGHYQATSSY